MVALPKSARGLLYSIDWTKTYLRIMSVMIVSCDIVYSALVSLYPRVVFGKHVPYTVDGSRINSKRLSVRRLFIVVNVKTGTVRRRPSFARVHTLGIESTSICLAAHCEHGRCGGSSPTTGRACSKCRERKQTIELALVLMKGRMRISPALQRANQAIFTPHSLRYYNN